MKKKISVMSIAVRSSIYKVLLILFGMIALQLGLFYYTYLRYDYMDNEMISSEPFQVLGRGYGVTWTLESLVEESYVKWVFMTAFILICMVLAWSEGERKGSHTYYFYKRIQVSMQERFVGWSLYNFGCMILLLLGMVISAVGMGCIFSCLAPEGYQSVQMYFMAFYKSRFLHNVFPMGEIFRWIRNALLFGACSMEIAGYACLRRKPWEMLVLILLILFGFVQDMGTFGGMDIIMILVSMVCIGVTIIKVFLDGGVDDDI